MDEVLQEEGTTAVVDGVVSAGGLSFIAEFIQNGGVFMWFIVGIWGIGIAIALERFSKLSFRFDVDGGFFYE